MINRKYLIIFFVLFLIILFIILFNYLFKEKNENKINKINKTKYVENFSSTQNISNINLILNGTFLNGSDIQNQIHKSGINKIIMLKNPGQSSYVLEQDKSVDLTYYQITSSCEKNSKYVLMFWLCVSNNSKPIDSLDDLNFEQLIKVKIQNTDYSNFVPKFNYNIIQKVIMNDNSNIWYLIKYDFITGSNVGTNMDIYLNYSNNLLFDKYYFTSISLFRTLVDAENFSYNNNLISYVDGYKYEINSTTWHDLSGHGNDLFWSNIPLTDYATKSINTLNFKLTGFPSNKLSSESFTILFCLNNEIVNGRIVNGRKEVIEEENSHTESNDHYFISIPGNDKYAFEIKLVKNEGITILCDNTKFTSTRFLNLHNKSLIAITYNSGLLTILQDGVILLSQTIRKCYFNGNNIMINKNGNINVNLYSILFYNRLIANDELNDIREYFITNKNNMYDEVPNINKYLMNTNYDYTITYDNNSLYKGYNKRDAAINYANNYDTDFDNQDYKLKGSKEYCVKDCKKLCYRFLESGDINKYNACIANCKNVLVSCEKYCQDSANKSTPYCSAEPANICPKVYKKNGEYIVYVNPNSEYAQRLNYSGERSYGKNLDKVRYLYHVNFPNCPIPKELMIGEGKQFTGKCPFVVNEMNPCHISACNNVNWSVKNYHDLKLNKNCKKTVTNYCSINYALDDKCICWDPKYKDDPKCVEFRKYFENPDEICKPGMFNIEDHPDFGKYIKKDNIPCWGCNVNM